MTAAKATAERRLKAVLAPYMDTDLDALRHEELEDVAVRLKCVRREAETNERDLLARAAAIALREVRRHRQQRIAARERRDAADGREC